MASFRWLQKLSSHLQLRLINIAQTDWALMSEILHHQDDIPSLHGHACLRTECIAAMIVVIVCCCIESCTPFVFSSAVEDLFKGNIAWRKIQILILLRVISSTVALQGLQNGLISRIRYRLHQTCQLSCYSRIMDLSADYHLSTPLGDRMTLMSRAESFVDSWIDLLSQLVPLVARLVIAVTAVSMPLRSELLGLLLATLVSLVVMNGAWFPHSLDKRTALNVRLRSRQMHAINTFLCWQTVAECQKIEFEKRRQHVKADECRQAHQEVEESSLALEACQELLAMISLLAACYYVLNDNGAHAKPEYLFNLLVYWTQATDTLRQCIKLYTRVLHGRQNATLLRSTLMRKPAMPAGANFSLFHFTGGAIELQDVSFGYSNRSNVIKSLSLRVEAGQKVALVGATGSGKSTIFRLVSRHFDPSSGRILVDGQDLRYVSLESYRKVLGVVSQNSVLMNVSIRENVAYPCVDAPPDRIVAACRAAEIHDTIMQFPNQYEHVVGDLAATLSGGEIQRLVLARLYMQDPKIVLLDEATSNLDGITEQKALALLNTFFLGKTVIIITHRLSTIQHVDKTLVIKDGEKVEEGTHAELIAKESGLYLAAVSAQGPVF